MGILLRLHTIIVALMVVVRLAIIFMPAIGQFTLRFGGETVAIETRRRSGPLVPMAPETSKSSTSWAVTAYQPSCSPSPVSRRRLGMRWTQRKG